MKQLAEILTPIKDIKGHSHHIRIKPQKGWAKLNLNELWLYRELLFFMTLRDIKIRYKQTVLGVLWAILQPFLMMIVFTLFFGNLAGIPSDGIPYPIFSFTALVPWTFFATGVSMSSNSLVNNANLLQKIYFPRLMMPIASVLANLVDFAISFAILLILMLLMNVSLTINLIFLPFFVVLALVTVLGVGLWLSALNVQMRDIRYTVPFLIQLWLFITPIAYPSSMIENEFFKLIYNFNPMVGVIDGFRWSLLGTETAPGIPTLVSAIIAIGLFVSGIYYFKRMESIFADVS